MTVDADQWGVERRYRDVRHQWHEAPAETVGRILRAMGANAGTPPAGDEAPLVVEVGSTKKVGSAWSLNLEDGSYLEGKGKLPADIPLGYHRLVTEDHDRRLIVAPSACKSYDGVRQWGWAAQLYAMRSRDSWGIGDLGDLTTFARLGSKQGASFVLLNPLHAAIPIVPQQASPYYPSSREFRNPLYIHVEHIPGVAGLDLGDIATRGRALSGGTRIDRDAIWETKMQALETIWATTTPASGFDEYIQRQGESLERYATYCALTEVHGSPWTSWPKDLQHPSSLAVRDFAQSHSTRVRFHQWLQWLIDEQLSRAGSELGLFNDLAIGVDPTGADAWLWQDAFALDMRVGAPPDEFNMKGQNWGLPPFDPWRLRELDYEPFIRTIRAGLAHAAGIRIDHVMGLFRLYWIPEGEQATEGTYVRYPWRDLLSILALESHRADALVVGEDLGTVEPYMRDELATRHIASYRLLWFESKRPSAYPRQSLAAITTHDLPTVAGLWTGSDLELQRSLGLEPNVESTNAIRDRIATWTKLGDTAPPADAVDACHRLLGTASSALVTATLEDALDVAERPNFPGTTDEYPNWSVPLPAFVDDFDQHPRVRKTAAVLRDLREPDDVS